MKTKLLSLLAVQTLVFPFFGNAQPVYSQGRSSEGPWIPHKYNPGIEMQSTIHYGGYWHSTKTRDDDVVQVVIRNKTSKKAHIVGICSYDPAIKFIDLSQPGAFQKVLYPGQTATVWQRIFTRSPNVYVFFQDVAYSD